MFRVFGAGGDFLFGVAVSVQNSCVAEIVCRASGIPCMFPYLHDIKFTRSTTQQ